MIHLSKCKYLYAGKGWKGSFAKLMSHGGCPQIWSAGQINSWTVSFPLCPRIIFIHRLEVMLHMLVPKCSTSPSAWCSSVFAKRFQSVPAMPRQCNVAVLKTLPRHTPPTTQKVSTSTCATTGTHYQSDTSTASL